MAELHAWPKVAGRPEAEHPKQIVRPCDYSLLNAINALETQLGTIEAYNRLAFAAAKLMAKIDEGQAKAQHPMFATSAEGMVVTGKDLAAIASMAGQTGESK